jgi:hypothetical protein
MGETVTLQFPFAGGLDQKTSAHYLDPSSRLASVVNGNFMRQGVVDKRFGMAHVAASSAVSGKLASWSRGDIVALSQAGLVSIDSTTGEQAALGQLPPARTTRRPLPSVAQQGLPPCICDVPNGSATLRVVASTGSSSISAVGTLVVSVYDTATQAVVLPPTVVYTASATAVPVNVLYLPNAPASEQVAIFFLDTLVSTNVVTLYCVNYNITTNTLSAPVTVTNAIYSGSSNGPPSLDVATFNGDPSGGYILAFSQNASHYNVQYMLPNHTLSAGPIVYTAPGSYITAGLNVNNSIYVYATYGASESIFVAYTYTLLGSPNVCEAFGAIISGSGSFAAVLGQTILNWAGSPTSILLVPPVRISAGTCWMGTMVPVGTTIASTWQTWGAGLTFTFSSAGMGGSTGKIFSGYVPFARPFVVGSTVYVPAQLAPNLWALFGNDPSFSSLQGTVLLLTSTPNVNTNLGTMLPVAVSAPRQVDLTAISATTIGNTVPGTIFHLPFGGVSGSKFSFPFFTLPAEYSTIQEGYFQTGTSRGGGAWVTTFDFASSLSYQCAELGQELHIGAGAAWLSDGLSTFEENFFFYPEFATAAQAGSGSSLTGAYTYAVVFTYVDGLGLIHRSAPVFTNAITLSGGQFPEVKFQSYYGWRDVTNPGQTFAEIYRTTSSPVTPVFYLLDRFACNGSSTIYADNLAGNSDANLQTNSILYTTGGVMDQVCPPSLTCLTAYKGRIWGVDDTLQTIWFTQQYSAGAAPGYNEVCTIAFSDGGDITALAAMDSELVVFKANSIWVIYGGDGPAPTGTGSDLTTPQRVPSDVGCVDWRSVVLTPAGLFFASSTGIYLLDRSLAVTYVGKNVADLFATNPVCTGAVLVPVATQVRFAMTNAPGGATTSIALVYDYLLGQWMVHQYATHSSPMASLSIAGNGAYTMLTSEGNVWQEGAGWFDQDSGGANHFVPTTIQVAEIKVRGPGALQAYQRTRWVQVYADRLDPHQLTIQLAFDGTGVNAQSKTWTYNDLKAKSFDQVSLHVGAWYTKSMSVQVTLSDSADPQTSTGQGARWAGIAVELDAIKDRYRQVASQNR